MCWSHFFNTCGSHFFDSEMLWKTKVSRACAGMLYSYSNMCSGTLVTYKAQIMQCVCCGLVASPNSWAPAICLILCMPASVVLALNLQLWCLVGCHWWVANGHVCGAVALSSPKDMLRAQLWQNSLSARLWSVLYARLWSVLYAALHGESTK
jgi:hypothetical protein